MFEKYISPSENTENTSQKPEPSHYLSQTNVEGRLSEQLKEIGTRRHCQIQSNRQGVHGEETQSKIHDVLQNDLGTIFEMLAITFVCSARLFSFFFVFFLSN